MYKTIVNPETGRKVNVNGKIGQRVLNKYKKQYGGAKFCNDHEPRCPDGGECDGLMCVLSEEEMQAQRERALVEWDQAAEARARGQEEEEDDEEDGGRTIADVNRNTHRGKLVYEVWWALNEEGLKNDDDDVIDFLGYALPGMLRQFALKNERYVDEDGDPDLEDAAQAIWDEAFHLAPPSSDDKDAHADAEAAVKTKAEEAAARAAEERRKDNYWRGVHGLPTVQNSGGKKKALKRKSKKRSKINNRKR